MKITLKDGSILDCESGITAYDVAKQISMGLARNACAAKIDDRTISADERIRSSVHNHLAVVTIVNEDSCGGCFSTITPQRIIDINSGKKLVICEHCGRIIVSPEL